ncbi:MAG: hypothetical protein RR877_10420 [Aurantimicrobium sp.]|uniref:hypothetical protein n=1 Tax=Aurantimicrobium sp. TaxID=1930784 RepID=UPI002FCBDC9E
MSTITYASIDNHTQQLIQSFLAGDEFTLELSDKVLSTFDMLDNTSYVRMLEHVKALFGRIKMERSGSVCFINLPYELSSKEKAVLVRFINISYKGNENIIVLNNNVVHIGSVYNKYDPEKVKDYIEKAISNLHYLYSVKQRKEKYNRWKDNLFRSFRFSNRSVVN